MNALNFSRRQPLHRKATPGMVLLISFALAAPGSCSKRLETGPLLTALNQAVRSHDFFYKQDPPIPVAAFEKAAKAAAPDVSWNGGAPAEELAKILDGIPADRREEAMSRAFNTLLSETTPPRTEENQTGPRNYYIGPTTDARLHDSDNSAGAGIVLYREASGRFRIVDIMEGSPAHLARVPQGVLIEKVEGQSVDGRELEDVVALIKGKTGTQVHIRADGKDYTLVRGLFAIQLMRRSEWDVNGKRLLYVEMRSTGKGAAKDIESLLMKTSGLDGLVLDLRKLNQGDIEEAFRVADLFVGEKTLGIVKRRDVAPKKIEADSNVLFTGKVYVLVSARTSSYLRTMAMALRQSSQVTFIGPDLSLQAFAGIEVPLDEKRQSGYAVIVDSTIESAGADRLHPEVEIEDFTPVNPPSSKPDPNDPAQAALLKRL